ncbi:hypothetical protein B0H14DRAFT_3436320 [Mycena olivaceomarginata]|nr:hypothetical protein B0H14DRAFT_3436320 [Mycena olivaceomarginata]
MTPLPSVGNPLGSPAFPGDTGGGGESFVGFDTTAYNRSLVLTYDYAVGGAVIDPALVPPITLSLPDEVDEFLARAAKPTTAPWSGVLRVSELIKVSLRLPLMAP